jgi:hypothetical protein
MKPGLRTGAVENLSQRVAALENMFLGQGVLWQQVFNSLTTIQDELPTGLSSSGDMNINGDILKEYTNRLKGTLSNLSTANPGLCDESSLRKPLKRKRACHSFESQPQLELPPLTLEGDSKRDDDDLLPPDDLMDDLVELYFHNIHPWIPILHVRKFRERMAIPAQRQKLTTIFHAITSLCVRFSKDSRLSKAEVRANFARRSRKTVILQSMESFSVENLQALVICAFDTVSYIGIMPTACTYA